MAGIDCDDCRQWIYDLKTGERRNVRRLPHQPTQCVHCPKVAGLSPKRRSPKEGKARTLSRKNWKTLRLYHKVQGCGAAGDFRLDMIQRKNLGIIHEILEGHKQEQQRGLDQMILAILKAR